MKIIYKISQYDDDGRIRYDLKVDGYTYHFWSGEELESFANRKSLRDSEMDTSLKEIIKNELLTRTAIEILEDKENKDFDITSSINIIPNGI